MSERSTDKSKVVIVIPSYNEGDRVKQVVSEVSKQGFKRIVVVDDHSQDDSIEPLRVHGVIILHHLLNRGAGAATETGLCYCRHLPDCDVVITIDADTQHDPNDLDAILEEHLKQKADITIGNRFINNINQVPLSRKIFNSIANITTSILSGGLVTDSQSGFKVLSKKALDKIILEQDQYEYCSEIFIKAHKHKLKVIDFPVRTYYPDSIKDKGQGFLKGVDTFMNLIYSVMFKNN